MEISLVKSVTIQYQPAQYRIELANDFLYAPTQPWQPGARPSCADVKHIDVLFACACHEFCQTIGAGGDGIAKSERHCRTFIGKAAILQLDLLKSVT